ncbi:iron ABC transporter permease, partial [Thermococcus sp. Bubb.Bath]
LSMLFMYLYLRSLDAYARREEQRVLQRPKRFTRKDVFSLKGLLIGAYSLAVLLFIIAPLLAVLYDSLHFNDQWSLEWYRRIFSTEYNPMFGATTLDAIRNSLTFGFATVFLSVIIALPVAYALHRWNFKGKRLFDVLVMLPLASSAITLGLGYIRIFHGTPLYYTAWLIIAAHTIIAYPFVLRAVSTSLKKIRPNLWEAALSLGAKEWKAFLRV